MNEQKQEELKVRKLKLGYLINVYLVSGNTIQKRKGVLTEGGKLYLVKKRKIFGYKVIKDRFYYVKPDHVVIEKTSRGAVLAVYVSPATQTSVPAPGSGAEPWRPEELELAQKVVSNVLIMRQFEEERKRLMQLMSRLQIIMAVMFVGVLVFAGLIYYFNAHQLAEQLNQIVQQVLPQPLPAPGAGGGGG